jgi:hypothetical protein
MTRMARIIKEIEIEGKAAVALFESGATFTYVRSSIISDAPRAQIKHPAHVVLGGQPIDITEICVVQGKIEGLDLFAEAVPVDGPGRANGHQLGALIGALTMERSEIKLDPKSGQPDLEGLRRREFTEY